MAEGSGSAWREVRVFISSTFRDMQAERDHLVRFVFPKLREELRRRRIHLVDVDLRWGVTADQDAFDLCMREIEFCRPRFICLLGGRYGWVPPPRVVEFEFAQNLLDGKSLAGQLTGTQRAAFEQVYQLSTAENVCRRRSKPPLKADVEQWDHSAELVVELIQLAGLADAERSITSAEVAHGALDTWISRAFGTSTSAMRRPPIRLLGLAPGTTAKWPTVSPCATSMNSNGLSERPGDGS